jgi:uncharacterized protein YndB with AHSA1/START domain
MSQPLDDIVHSIDIEAARTTAWEVLTGVDTVPRWLGCMNYEMREGATFHMQSDSVRRAAADITGATWCDIEELRAPERFVFSWYMPGMPKTRVAIELSDLGGDLTRATLTHSGWGQFPPETIRAIHDMLAGGWKAFVLPGLKKAAEDFRRQLS